MNHPYLILLNIYDEYDEHRHFYDSLIGLTVSFILLGYVAYFSWKHWFGPIPRSWLRGEFPSLLPHSKENVMKAYICLGSYMLLMERKDISSQLNFMHRYLKTKFSSIENYTFSDIKAFADLKISPQSTLKWCASHTDDDRKIQILDFLADLAFHNQSLSSGENKLLLLTAQMLGIEKSTYDSVIGIRMEQFQRYQKEKKKRRAKKVSPKSRRDEALHRLGLNSNASPDEIKKRYRSLAKKFHPDRFVRMGEDELRMANERFAAINHAYDVLTG